MRKQWFNDGTKEYLLFEDSSHQLIKGRLNKISKLDILKSQYSKEVLYKLYIIGNKPFHKLANELGISRSDLRRLLTCYKITKNSKLRAKNNHYKRDSETSKKVGQKSSVTQKRNWENKSKEEKEKWKQKQKISHNSVEFKEKISSINKEYCKNLKETNLELFNLRNEQRKISCKKAWANPELIARRNETTRENRLIQKNKLCRTISEQKLYDTLIKKYSDLQYDIRVDDRYPYYCDFYIPRLDLFIELQAHPSHGRLPFDYLKFDEYSKYPNKWVDVFARRDVEKFNTAIKNNINLIRIYPQATLEDNLNINDKKFKDIVELCYYTQK